MGYGLVFVNLHFLFAQPEESDANPGSVSRKANIRTLALAIVPGQHIQSIAAAKQFVSQTLSGGDKRTAGESDGGASMGKDVTQEGSGLKEGEEATGAERTLLSCTTVPE